VTLTVVAKAELAREKVSEIVQSVAKNLRGILANPQGKPQLQRASGQEEVLVNGVGHELGSSKKDGFEWDERATILRKTIAELAEVDESEISADSSILELGLDSIEAIKLASRLRQHGIDLSVSIIMRNPTIRKMHEILNAASDPKAAAANSVDPLVEFERKVRKTLDLQGVAAVYPTTPLQEAMIAETLASEYALYFNHDVLKLQESVGLARLKDAWALVVKNNGILRTSFVSLEDLDVRQAYGQVVQTSTEFYWNEIEVAEDDAVAEEIEAAMKRTKEYADLLREPPVYVTVLKAPRSSHFVLSISHALYDGWSIGLLHEDLKRAYLASITARPDPRLMIEQIVNTDIEESKRFWQQRLHGTVSSRFPSLDASAAEPAQTHRAEKISSVPFSEIQAFCKKVVATPQSLGQAVWALALAHHLGETDVVFGSVLSGRDFDGADEIMFPAMNTVPVRAILHGSYRDMLSYMQENGAMTLKHQHTPLREIQRLVNTGGTRLFDTIFLYQRSQTSADNERQLYDSVGGASDVEVCLLSVIVCSWADFCEVQYRSGIGTCW
jgi:aryl carrier-like protein